MRGVQALDPAGDRAENHATGITLFAAGPTDRAVTASRGRPRF
jgi:hypothetical protein